MWQELTIRHLTSTEEVFLASVILSFKTFTAMFDATISIVPLEF